jgi:hypothetical protein
LLLLLHLCTFFLLLLLLLCCYTRCNNGNLTHTNEKKMTPPKQWRWLLLV